MRKMGKIIGSAVLCVILTIIFSFNTFALETENLSEGTYSVDATLSCYVNAMGGIEFGAPLLTGSTIKVDTNGKKTMTLNFTKSSVTIYNITCDTFIDPSPTAEDSKGGIKNGTIGIYDDNGNLQTDLVEYTLSDDTALNSKSEEVHYVTSISFPIERLKDTYELTVYVNSNVMGVQFGTGGSDGYPATLTVDRNSLKAKSAGTEQYETLPNKTKAVQATTEVVVEDKKSDTVVEKNGLNIHYANGENESADKTSESYTAYLNMPLLWLMTAIAAVIIIAGIVFIISSKFKRKRDNK
ncbi:MAG: hypothetical protein EGR46_05180 [Ruminococcus sp.]|uniref:hypothetical protein n=1 Tax=Ruminococcus sp. TaxID=41978 RepID=UPI0025E211A9|nr:hypothetical protein [Ruminococcus sp.]MBD9048317.1 hypothetical protein [Ruminococcus sp.]